MSNTVRKHFIFHGDVQGVGFRYRSFHAANIYGVSGWVRNLSDGTVEMEAEGREIDIDNVISIITNASFVDITNIEEKIIPICNSHKFEYK